MRGTFACVLLLIASLSSAMAFEFARRAEESSARAAEIERDASVQIDKYKLETERARALSERQGRTAQHRRVEPSLDALRKENSELKASLKRATLISIACSRSEQKTSRDETQ